MKLKTLLFSALCALAPLGAMAQTNSAHSQAHAKARQAQAQHHVQAQTPASPAAGLTAKATTAADHLRLDKFIEENVAAREAISLPGLSGESSRMVDDLLTEARRHIGKRYVHGSKGPNTFDCSGFTSYVYKQFGYTISPASRIQANDGVPVAKGDLRKGDLVFFTSPRSGGGVGHVGIVVEADNSTGSFKFIHASLKGVKISENTGYYARTYLRARRVITK